MAAGGRGNQLALALRSNGQSNGSDDEDDSNSALYSFGYMLGMLMAAQSSTRVDPAQLVREAARGNVDNVRAILQRFPSQVNIKVQNITALHAASHEGHQQVVAVLLNAGARPEITDHEGDTAFHFAANGAEPAVMEMLLRKSSAGKDLTNKFGRTALHIAVYKQYPRCVSVLLNYNCNVNIQDSVGDTPLHDALGKPNAAIVEMLLATRRVKLELKNKKGFNVFHLAGMHGANVSLSKMIPLAPQLVNSQKSDGFTALHLAALNGYPMTASCLIDQGNADMEIKNNSSQTPLLCAVRAGQLPVVEVLVEKGADVESEDSDGDTALQNALIFMNNSATQAGSFLAAVLTVMFKVQPKDIEKAPRIHRFYQQLGGGDNDALAWLSVACYLVASGADLNHRNNSNRSPLDLAVDTRIRNLLLSCRSRQQAVTRVQVIGCRQQ